MHLAISGYSGCGNTTVSGILSKKLNANLVNFTFRNLAKEKGMDFEALRSLAEKDDSFDRELDCRQVDMAEESENSILSSRLAIWMLRDADLKVFLDISLEERARRVHNREGGEFNYWLKHTSDRDDRDNARYLKLYNINNRDLKTGFKANELLIIGDDKLNPEQISDIILNEIQKRRIK